MSGDINVLNIKMINRVCRISKFYKCLFRFLVGYDGTFLVRKSKNGGEESPYALTIFYNANIFHINIRSIAEGKYALGKSKANEMVSKCNLALGISPFPIF